MTSKSKALGFTLAELLIALSILGVIATFTIPKILMSSQNGKFNAIGKEAASTVSGAFQLHQQKGLVSANTQMSDLTPYLNYAAIDTTSVVDYLPTQTSFSCSAQTCYRLHNGAILWFWSSGTRHFTGTSTAHAIEFFIDPDGVSGGGTATPGKSVGFYLYYNGRISSRGFITNPSTVNGSVYTPMASLEPDWFTW